MKSIMILGLNRSETPDGVTRHAANLALALNRISLIKKIYIVVGVWQRDYFINSFGVMSDKIEIIPIEIENSMKNRNLWYIFQFYKIIMKYSPDLVHFAFPMPFLKKKISVPVVTTIHDLYPYDIPENFGFPKVLFNKYFLKEAIKKSDGLICVSKNTQKRLFDLFPKTRNKKNSVIYNYVDFDKVEPLLPKDLENYSDINFILCVGQHRKNKNIDVAIKAFKKLINEKKIDDSMLLIIAGAKGPETDSILSLIDEFGLKDRVIPLYSLTDKNLNWLYKNCKVNVCASSFEGFCLPLVEALSCNAKVVCSDIEIFREIAGDECVFFPLEGDSVSNLSKALIESFNKTPRQIDYETLKKYSGESVSKKLIEFYESLTTAN